MHLIRRWFVEPKQKASFGPRPAWPPWIRMPLFSARSSQSFGITKTNSELNEWKPGKSSSSIHESGFQNEVGMFLGSHFAV